MYKKTMKAALLAAVAGTLFAGFGGCLGNNFTRQLLVEIVADQVAGFVPDLGGVLGGGDDAAP